MATIDRETDPLPKNARIVDQDSYRAQGLAAALVQMDFATAELRTIATKNPALGRSMTQTVIRPHNYSEAMLTSSDAQIKAWNETVAQNKRDKQKRSKL